MGNGLKQPADSYMKQKQWLAVALAIIGGAVSPVPAANWPQWRGPFLNGSSPEANLPVAWSKTNQLAWAAPLPGKSGATPIVWDDTIFLPSPDPDKNLLLFCLDRGTGQVRWQKKVAQGDRVVGKNNLASPSAVTDGQKVICLFGTGDLAAFDFAGGALWSRNLCREYGQFANMWQYGASPLLHAGRLYIQVLQRDPPTYGHARDDRPSRESFLLCVDPATGKDLWRQVRKTDAREESMEAYTTPLPVRVGERTEIVVVGANYVTGHDAEKGDERWRCGGLNRRQNLYWRIITSPVAGPGLVYAVGPKRDPLLAIKVGGSGLVTDTQVAWTVNEFTPDVCTPLLYRERLLVLDGDRQVLTSLNPATGEKQWQGNLGVRETFSASPTGADGKIYCVSEKGTVVVLEAGPEFKILATFSLGEGPVMSSIVAAQGCLFLRTAENLYCASRR